jgi:hypothetical protein
MSLALLQHFIIQHFSPISLPLSFLCGIGWRERLNPIIFGCNKLTRFTLKTFFGSDKIFNGEGVRLFD